MPLQFSIPSSLNKKNIWAVPFFALLFFLCCADMFFTTHIHGFNFRWGQILLLAFAFPALLRFKTALQNHTAEGQTTLKILLSWLPFFVIYGVAAIFSTSPLLTGIKWGWGVFNIGLAALICLDTRTDSSLEEGFQWGLVLISAYIWLESIAIYILSSFTSITDLEWGHPSEISFLHLPIGYAQRDSQYHNLPIYRSNAFYYEPSYAGCALTFALFLLFFLDIRRSKSKSGWIPAIVLSAVMLTTSRAGVVSAALFIIGVPTLLLLWRHWSTLWRSLFKTILISSLLIWLFCLFPNSRTYMELLADYNGAGAINRLEVYMKNHSMLLSPKTAEPVPETVKSANLAPAAAPSIAATPVPIEVKNSSEWGRLDNLKESFVIWMQHPLLGNGVTPQPQLAGYQNTSKGLSQISGVTWTEVGLESGILGFAAFLFALLANMTIAWRKSIDINLKTLVLVAWIMHFGIQFILSQTFPRLDYWLIFFLSIRLLIKSGESKPSAFRV